MTRFEAERPRAGAAFYKAHGLGNDYLVVEGGDEWTLDEASVRLVCHRWEGVGADGIVVVLPPLEEPFRLRMFNPDGSEFERSGNGLRVAASWLRWTGRVETGRPFEVEVCGDRLVMTVHGRDPGGGWDVSVEMGRAEVGPGAVGLEVGALGPAGPGHRAGGRGGPGAHGRLSLSDGGDVPVHLVSVGNPHCVVF
ncbi:MAG TPA: hypothetical protein VLL48_02940, partial [Longimicrobiales bacterium]|nr:hypothetical protein [Longimicrobiales bacterium]